VEIQAAFDILQATQRRVRKPELIACPTCGRIEINLEELMKALERRLGGRKTPVKISVLGCVVNGPGEAREADLGIAAGNGKGMIFKRGEMLRTVTEAEMVDALVEEIERWESEERDQGRLPPAANGNGKTALPLIPS
jgi:(E)-4-hydroxy-3-methylbut-2-enyl-diphosphate synthase